MDTYPLEEKCALVIVPELAAVISVRDAEKSGAAGELPEKIRDALRSGKTAWECVADPALYAALEEDGWNSVSDAFDIIQDTGDTEAIYCSEFTGAASVPAEFAPCGGADREYRSAYMAALAPRRAPDLFKAAYGSREELVSEFLERLGGLACPGMPLERFILDISGTYYC